MAVTIYTSIRSSGSAVANSHKYVASESNADSILQKYAVNYRDTSENKAPPSLSYPYLPARQPWFVRGQSAAVRYKQDFIDWMAKHLTPQPA
ncbi:hypothetical protein V8E55_005339 [Tylopilus felleus]